MTLADAITQLEGTNPAYNNPGSISGTGDTGTSFGAGIGIYSTLAAGQQALQNQLNLIASGQSAYYTPDTTLADFGTTYSGGNPSYGNNLANLLGVSPSTPIGQVINQNGSSVNNVSSTNLLTDTYNRTKAALSSQAGGSFFGIKFTLEGAVIIIVGLILIAAGLFSFKQTQTLITTVGRTAKRGAEIAAS